MNVGAGTITCNYDGQQKHPTVIEDGAFIGSDTQLIAPVRVGKGAYVGAGSSITEDVPAGALGIARGRQTNVEGWVERRRKARAPKLENGRRTRDQGRTMCGIIGYIGSKPVVPVLIEGLRRMEYRGYDSAGVARRQPRGDLAAPVGRASSRTSRHAIRVEPVDGLYGVGHTRWATHGRPTEENAHPHRDCTGRIVVVHNGIIENYLELKKELQAQGHEFKTETDTEIVAHLVEREMRDDGLENAVRRALLYMRGMFAIVLVSVEDPEKIVAVRNGPPIVVGLGEDEFFVASDIPAILAHTRDVVFLGDEEMAVITRSGVQFTDYAGRAVSKTTQRVTVGSDRGGEGRPQALHAQGDLRAADRRARHDSRPRVARSRPDLSRGSQHLRRRRSARSRRSRIIACGTSWHAALVGKYLIEALAQVPVEVDYGSEYRYRNPIVGRNELTIVITQSGETADTLAALREAKPQGRAAASPSATSSAAWRRARPTAPSTRTPDRRSASPRRRRSRRSSSRLQLLALYMAQVRGTLTPTADSRITSTSCCSCRRRSSRPSRRRRRWRRSPSGSTTGPTSSSSAAASTTRSRSKAR